MRVTLGLAFVLFALCKLTLSQSHDQDVIGIGLEQRQAEQNIKKAFQALGVNFEKLILENGQLGRPSNVKSPGESDAVKGIREAIRRRFDLYINQVREVHGLDSGDSAHYIHRLKTRRRRSVIRADNVLPGRRRRNITEYNPVGSQVVARVYPLNPQPFSNKKLVDLDTIAMKGESYVFTLEVTPGGTYTSIYIIGKDMTPRVIFRELTTGATGIKLHNIDSQIYVLLANYSELRAHPFDTGSNLFRFDPYSKKMTKQQTIDISQASALHFWTGTGDEANDVYLAAASQFQMRWQRQTFEVDVSIYRWQGAYFDYVYSLPAKCPHAISYARIMSTGFLALANYQDDTGTTAVHSEIFRYQHKESKYVSFQKILTHGAMSLEFFSFVGARQEEYFLAIANRCHEDKNGKWNYRVKSHIFKYGLERFIPFQSFETYGAFQILSVKMDSKSFLVIGEINGIRIFQYNGWKFTQTQSFNYESETMSSTAVKLRPFVQGSQPYFAIASLDTHIQGGIYAMEFKERNDYNEMAVDLEGECKKALGRMMAENMTSLLEAVNYAPKTSKAEIFLQVSLEFVNRINIGNLGGKAISYSTVLLDADASKRLAMREREIGALQNQMDEFKEKVAGVVLRNEDRTISTQIHFQNIDYSGSQLKSSNVTAERVNGHRLKDILPKLIHLSRDYSFESVTMDVVATNQHIKVEKLNGDYLVDFALKSSSEQTFRGDNRFSGFLTAKSGFKTHGLLDGVDLKIINFLLKNGNQTFHGGIHVRKSEVANLVSEIVNGVALGYFLSEGVSRFAPARITGTKHFEFLQAGTFQSDGRISGVEVEKLYVEAIVTDGKPEQIFQGRETIFESLETKSLAVTKVKLNEKWNLEDFVSTSKGRYDLEFTEFLYDTKIAHLKVNKSLNRIRVSNDELDIILMDSPLVQRIENKVLDGILLEKDSETRSLIDGMNLSSWSHEKRIQLSQQRLRVGNFVPNGIMRIDDGIHIDKYARFFFCEKDITRLLQNALLLNSIELPYTFRGGITFSNLRVLGNTYARTVNRRSTSDWLTQVDKSNSVVVRGQKMFNRGLSLLTSSTASGLYYKHGRFLYGKAEDILTQLQDLLIDGRDQTIQRNSVFHSLLSVDRLICSPEYLFLDGLAFQSLVLVNSNQTIEGRVKFSKARVKKFFVVNGNVESALLNSQELTSLLQDTLKKHSTLPQYFHGSVKFNRGLTVENLESEGNVGGYNLSLLLHRIVRKDSSGQSRIEGSLNFAQGANINEMKLTGSLNGIEHEEWGQGFLLKSHTHQVVHTPVEFQSLSVKNLTVSNDRVSHYYVARLSNEILRVDEGGSVGVVFFTGLLAGQNIQTNRVNGYNVHDDLLLSHEENLQIVKGSKTFTSGWRIDESLRVHVLAGIDYEQAAKFAFGNTNYKDNLRIKGNFVIKKEPYFQSYFNGKEWKELVDGVWWTDEPTTVHTQNEFEKLTLVEGGLVKGFLGEVDIVQLEKEYLSQSKNQRITGKLSFDSSISFETLKAQRIHLEHGKINGVDLEDFQQSVFLHGVEQTIDLPTLFSEVSFEIAEVGKGSLIGGINLNSMTMRLHAENVFTGEVILEDLNVDELLLGNATLLNGVHLGEWIENSLKGSQATELFDRFEFIKVQFAQNIFVAGLVDGMTFSPHEVLTLSDDQKLRGSVTLKAAEGSHRAYIRAKSLTITNGYVNGINLQSAIDTLVLKNYGTGPLIVSGEKTFLQSLMAESMVTESLFQGFNMSETLETLKPQAHLSPYFNESLEKRYQDMSQLALALHKVADRRGVFLEYFDLTNRLVYPSTTSVTGVKVVVYHGTQKIFISTKGNEDSTHRLSWGPFSTLQLSYNCDFRGIIRDFVEIERQGQAFLVVSMSSLRTETVQPLLEFRLTKTGTAELEGASAEKSRTFILKLSSTGDWVVHQLIHGYDFRNVATVHLVNSNADVRHCVVLLVREEDPSGGKVLVLCFDPVKTPLLTTTSEDDVAMQIFQTLPANQPSLVETLTTKEKTFLLVGNGIISGEVVDVWTHDPRDGKFAKESCIPATNILSMDLSEGIGGQVFLAIATGEAGRSQGTGGVYIYRYSMTRVKFEKIQSIALGTALAVAFQGLDFISTQQLLFVQADTTLFVYSYRGLSGFVLEHVIPTTSATMIETTSHVLNGIFNAHTLVASSTEVQVYSAELNGVLQYEKTT